MPPCNDIALVVFFGLESSFWLIMSLGWVVFFAGVLLTSRRTATVRSTNDNRNSVEAQGPIAST